MSAIIESPIKKTWKRLKKNKAAIVSLIIICIAIFIAFFAPILATDKTPDADEQILELANVSPGFSTKVLKVKKNRDEKSSSFLNAIFLGKENDYEFIPIKNYTFDDSANILIDAYKGEDHPIEKMILPMVDVVYPLSIADTKITYNNNKATFYTYNNQQKTVAIDQLKKEIKSNLVINKTFRLGSDGYGRDILSRLLFGVRVSLTVGFFAVIISLTIGIFFGSIAGFYRGKTDTIVMWIINVVWSIPTILLAMAIRFAIGDKINSFFAIFIAIGLSMWVEVARIVRGQILSLREMEYIQAARSLGYNDFRIILKHILPNIIGPIMVIAASDFASAILIEAGLSFVGIGVKPPTPSWGNMLNENYAYLFTEGKAFLALAPGFCIMILVLVFNILGNGLRDAFDVKGKTV